MLLSPHLHGPQRPLVASHVKVERAFGLKALAADGADIGFLSRVNQDVPLQVHVLHETFTTNLAKVGALLEVEAHMHVQCLFLSEATSAQVTGEGALPCVDLQVCLQVATLVKCLATDGAAVRPLTGVDTFMHQE